MTPSHQRPPPAPPLPPTPPQLLKDVDDQCLVAGSIIGCQNQTLGERVAVVGTPFVLQYQSDRVPGRSGANAGAVAHARTLGAWSFNVHHVYDPTDKILFLGNGSRRSADLLGSPVHTASGEFLIASEDGSEIYVFDGSGSHLRTLDGLTAATRYQFSYDADERLISITDGSGNVTTITRDGNGTPSGIVGPFGQTTQLTVDANGFLATITNPANEVTALVYTPDGLLTSLTDPRGDSYTFTYDSGGRLHQDADLAGGSSTLSRTGTPNDYTAKLTTALNRTSSYQVQTLVPPNSKRTNTDPAGLSTVESIGSGGNRTITSPDGTVIQIVNAPDPRFGMQVPIRKAFTVSTPGGLKFDSTESRTTTLADPNDPLSVTEIIGTETINGRSYTTSYKTAAKEITETTPMRRSTVTSLDAQGRPVRFQFSGLEAVSATYDAAGRVETVTVGSGVEMRTITFSYNTDGYVQTITDPLNHAVNFAYDTAGRVTQQTSPDGSVTGYSYDADGNVAAITPPGRPIHSFSYSPVDLVSAYIAPDVGTGTNETDYAYNVDRQLSQIGRPGAQKVDFGYDNAGRPTTVTTADGMFRYTYDSAKGNVATIRAPDGIGLSYTYDGSLLTGTTWVGPVSGSVTRTYDNNFRTATLSLSGTPAIPFSYDNDGLLVGAGDLKLTRDVRNGLLTGTTIGNATDQWTYNGFGEPIDYTAAYSGSTIFRQQYARDKLGRITQKIETVGGRTTTYDYSYDLAGRLESVIQNGALAATYAYDSNGNRLSVTRSSGTISGSYDAQDRLTRYGAPTFAYTDAGDLESKTISGQITSIDTMRSGNLREVVLPNGTQIRYLIDGRNRRIGKQVNGSVIQGFTYQDALNPIAELDASNNIVSRFIYATRSNVPDYMIKGGVSYRIFTDQLW